MGVGTEVGTAVNRVERTFDESILGSIVGCKVDGGGTNGVAQLTASQSIRIVGVASNFIE